MEWGYENIEVSDCLCYSNTLYGIHVSNTNGNNFVSGNTITGSSDVGIMIDNSINCIISDNTIVDNNDGIRLDGSNSNILEYNTVIENNKDGIWLVSSVDNIISNNNIGLNYEDNIHIGGGSNDNIITNNNVTLSGWDIGILCNGDGNQIYHNNLIDNAQNAGDDGYGNTWDNGYPSGGNYWSDYSGEDSDGDGIGDSSYIIPGTAGSEDLYPFMKSDGWQLPPNFVYVDDDYNPSTSGWGYDHFDCIQDGVDAVAEGGTVYVLNGTYYENVVIHKSINLVGEDKDSTIIDGGGTGNVISIFFNMTNMSGFTIQNSGSEGGIYIWSNYNIISGNSIINNDASGIHLHSSSNNVISDNNIVNNNYYGIFLMSASSYNTISDNIISLNSDDGIALENSYNNTISGNIISNNIDLSDGISIKTSSNNNTIVANIITNNYDGIVLYESHYNIFYENMIADHISQGVHSFTQLNDGNIFYHNNFINNTENAHDESTNTWYDEILQEGNYWDDYTGEDNNWDRIGDTPYDIPGGSNQDLYPLMYPWSEMPPIANFSYSADYLSVTFDASDSFDHDGEIISYSWNFGDDNYGSGIIVEHTYSEEGEYAVTLTVTDDDGYEGNKTILIFVESPNQPPYAPSDPDPEDGETDVSIDVDLSWTGGDPDGDPVLYDVYLDTVSPPAIQVSINQSSTTYNPELDYETTYYWQIVAWDNHDANAVGPIWEFTTEEEYIPVPDLDCSGDLHWTDVQPGATVTEEITVENIGEPLSMLDWEITEYPDWGTWTFDPESGEDLIPEDGPETIGVSVIAPDEENQEFSGHITIVNIEDDGDYCIIDVSLATPATQMSIQSQSNLFQFIQSRIFNNRI